MSTLTRVATAATLVLVLAPVSAASGNAPARIPLTEAAPAMEPAAVWEAFADLTTIPRP